MESYRHKIGMLLFCCFAVSVTKGQFATDHRQLEEHMRYSIDKPFNTWAVAVGFGPFMMQNDLSDYTVFPDENWKFGPMIKISKQLFPVWALDFQFLTSDFYSGNAVYYSKGNVADYSLNIVSYINQWLRYPGPLGDRWNVFVKGGIGLTAFRTRVRYTANDDFVHFSDFSENSPENGYLVAGYDRQDPTNKVNRAHEFVIPLTLGVQYRLNRSFDIGLETSMRWSLEDKLEDILVGSDNDRYWYTNIHIAYKIGRKNKRHSRWTHRGYGFNIFGIQTKDPLEDEAAQLAKQVDNYDVKNLIRVDSVTFNHHAKKVYGSGNLKSIFFHSLADKLDTEDYVVLATVGLYLSKNPKARLKIYGYNNDRNDAVTNKAVSLLRCEETRDFFVKDLGVDVNRIELFPEGENDLLLPPRKKSPRGLHHYNRRVDVVILDE